MKRIQEMTKRAALKCVALFNAIQQIMVVTQHSNATR
jgi:hypothetical protein